MFKRYGQYLIPFYLLWASGVIVAGNTQQGLLAVYCPPVAIYHSLKVPLVYITGNPHQ